MEKLMMRNYDFVEGIEFEGLMPKVAEEVGSIGSGSSVSFMGAEALGSDPLEVADFASLMDDSAVS